MKIKKEYDNYEILLNKMTKLLDKNGFAIVKSNQNPRTSNSSRVNLEKVLGDMQCSELTEYYQILQNILDIGP